MDDRDDEPKLPFVRGSDTSREAAIAKQKTSAADEALVYAFLEKRGATGATDDEIESGLGMSHQNASARRNGLVKKGRVKDSGERRKTRYNRAAAVWILGKGEAVVGFGNIRVARPSPKKLLVAVACIDTLILHAHAAGGPSPPPELQEVTTWLKHLGKQKLEEKIT